jgi:hypothetical protein
MSLSEIKPASTIILWSVELMFMGKEKGRGFLPAPNGVFNRGDKTPSVDLPRLYAPNPLKLLYQFFFSLLYMMP